MSEMEKQLLKDAAKDERVRNAAVDLAKEQMTKENLNKAGKVAGDYGKKGLDAFKTYVQAGPAGIQILCFFCGVTTTVIGILNMINIFRILFAPFEFILSFYTFLFGVVTICIEADADRMEQIAFFNIIAPRVLSGQQWLHINAKFLTLLAGRGLFYMMIGLVMLAQCTGCILAIAGSCNIGLGIVCLLMYLGHAHHITSAISMVTDNEYDSAKKVYLEKKDKLNFKAQKEMEALLKQVEDGDLDPTKKDQARPGMFDTTGKAMWEARKKLVGVKRDEAKALFVCYAQRENLIEGGEVP